ncbi:hypothetical protein FQR65_LT09226 [Abscondita terminalis]|nr:hypothetical protein FQR65_LT09226 [Abscondita terminalis]
MADPRLKSLKIKTGVVRRLAKEKVVYEKEADQQRCRIEKFKGEGKDEYDIRKQEEVLQETLMMVPDCQRKLGKAIEELKNIIDNELDLQELDEYQAAVKIIEEAKLQLPTPEELAHYYPRFNCMYYNPIPLNTPTTNHSPFPLYDVSVPNINTIESKSDEELWIETWLSKIGKIQINLNSTIELKPIAPIKTNSVQIHTVKDSLKNCIEVLNNLKTLQEYLKENAATMSTTDWKKKTMEIGIIKEQFSKHILQFENSDTVNKIQRVIEHRRKKRRCQKKRKKLHSDLLSKIRNDNQRAHKDIDQWLENMKEEVERAKQEENLKKDADCVLAEVTKKKSDARKSLTLISSLIKLRQVREHAATQRGEKSSLEDHNAFAKVTEHLTQIWNDALRVYSKEEQGLRMMLEQNAVEDTISARIAKEKRIIQQWENVFFGPRWIPNHIYWNLTAAEKDTETFIAIRKSWDTFLTSNSDGSRIPIGWVVPNSHPNEDWSSVTLTTIGDYLHIDNLIPIVERWNGPVSVALHAAGFDFYHTLESIAYLRNCNNSLFKKFVTFHIVTDSDHLPQLMDNGVPLSRVYKDEFDCTMEPPFLSLKRESMYKTQKNLKFPINLLRNVARESAQTHFVLAADMELYPSENIIKNFLDMVVEQKQMFKAHAKNVFVLPIFEVESDQEPPFNKAKLIEMYNKKTAFLFHQKICYQCHAIPKISQWLTLPIEDNLNPFVSAKRSGKHLHWEPFYIGTNFEPFFEERINWENGGDKMTQNYKQCLLDYDYWILDNAFLVHRPGIKVYTANNPDKRNEPTEFTNRRLHNEYHIIFGRRKGC